MPPVSWPSTERGFSLLGSRPVPFAKRWVCTDWREGLAPSRPAGMMLDQPPSDVQVRSAMRSRAFSLLELVVVVVIIGVIAAIAVPRMSGFAAGSKVQAAASSVRAMQEKVIEHQGLTGAWPSTLDPDWFMGGRIPANPYAGSTPRGLQAVSGGADVSEPTIKTLGSGKAAFWYNRDNGEIRARVPDLGNASATLALYNAVNGTSLTAIADTKTNIVKAVSDQIAVDLGG